MNNAKLGAHFEQEFCELLASNGFWVHRLSQNSVGQQPADVIAVYHGFAYLIDCKVCSNDRFSYGRMEDNQRMAMDKWLNLGGAAPLFALKDSKNRIWMLNYEWAKAREEAGEKGTACARDRLYICPFAEWLEWVR